MKKQIGGYYYFRYPNYGTPDSHPDYTAHSGQIVMIVRTLTDAECDLSAQPMYKIQAADGWTGSAHASELRKAGVAQRRKHCLKSAKDLKECAMESEGDDRRRFGADHRAFSQEAHLTDGVSWLLFHAQHRGKSRWVVTDERGQDTLDTGSSVKVLRLLRKYRLCVPRKLALLNPSDYIVALKPWSLVKKKESRKG